MENLGLQEDASNNPDTKYDNSDTKYDNPDTKYDNPDTKYDSDVASSPESKRRRLMSDSSSSHSHTEDPTETFGSPEAPIPMPVPDVKKEEEVHSGIVMPTDPEARRLSDADKPGPSSGGLEEGAEMEADKGEAGGGEDAPKEEMSKAELAKEERRKMQVLVSSFSEEQLNRYEMYRRSSFPKAAIKRTDANTGQTRATNSTSQPTVIPETSQNASHQQPAQPHGGLSLLQSALLQQSVKQEPGVEPPAAVNPNIALQQALSALQPLLLQTGAVQPTIGLQPTLGLPNLSQLFQAPPAVPLLPIQQLMPGLMQSPYQPSPSTTVFVLPQPIAAQVPPATETSHNHQLHKNCCPGCLSEIQELRRLVDLIIRANTNTITPAANITPLFQQQQLHQATSSLLQQQLQQATSALSNTSIPIINPGVQRLIQNPSLFSPAVATVGSANDQIPDNKSWNKPPARSGHDQIPDNKSWNQPPAGSAHDHIPDNKSWNQPPSLASNALQKRTDFHPGSNSQPGCHSDWQEGDDGLDSEPMEDKSLPTSTTTASSMIDDYSQPGPSHHNNPRWDNPRFEEPLWKSKKGKNTMEQIQDRLEPDPLNLSRYIVKDYVLYMVKQKSDDRQFIARRLANLLFTKQERRISNCHGRRHKRQLDPVRLDAIKRAVFNINPVAPDNSATRDIVWKQCCASIDMSSRSACRNIKQPEEI